MVQLATSQSTAAGKHAPYDPVKSHAYYEAHKQLKGRRSGSGKKAKAENPRTVAAKARINRLRGHLSTLRNALTAIETELSNRRQKTQQKSVAKSTGPTTVKQKLQSQQSQARNQAVNKTKQQNRSSSGAAKNVSSNNSGSGLSGMSVDQLVARETKIKGLIAEAQRQLSNANQELGHLAHSALVSDPQVNELFAHFQSAERMPSK